MSSSGHVLFSELEDKAPAAAATVTAADIVGEQQRLEEEAAAQLEGDWGDEDACTYDRGYCRQPVYSCATCAERAAEPGSTAAAPFAVCFGCSMDCHVDHDVFELFDKRHIRCDCGTPRSRCACRFNADGHAEDNAENVYGHNFGGRYCWCDAAYTEDQTMYQCVLCMDWFHLDCITKRDGWALDDTVPSDFVCGTCIERHPFIARYSRLAIVPDRLAGTDDSNVGGMNASHEALAPTLPTEGCKLGAAADSAADASAPASPAKSMFFGKSWRSQLCRCPECLSLYKTHGVPFLGEDEEALSDDETEAVEDADAAEAPEPAAAVNPATAAPLAGSKRKATSLLAAAEDAFMGSGIPQTKQIDLMQGYQDMQSALKVYLKQFADSGKEVTKKDIDDFFVELKNKRARVD